MRRIKLFFLGILMGITSLSMVVSADATLPDGTVINRYTSWEEVPSSYEGLDYYDVLVPYSKKISEIGGQSIGGRSGTPHETSNKMLDSLVSNFVGDYVSIEYKIGGSSTSLGGSTVGISEVNGLNIATDEYGNKYYLLALGHYFYPQDASINGFYPFSSSNRGQLIDVVLTDGTVIHCLIGDAKADVHTNGGEGSSHNSDTSNLRDYYEFAPMEYDEGQNMFQAKNSEVIEVFADGSGINEFRNTFNMHCNETSNHIAFIRLYKGTYYNSGNLRLPELGTNPSYNLGSVTFSQGDASSGSGLGSAALGLTGSSMVDEWDIVGMPIKSNLTKEQMTIVLLGRGSLSLNEADLVSTMGENIYLLKQAELLDFVRTAIVFTGLVVFLYGFLLGLAIIFDKANTFIDFSLVNILTLGKLHYDPFEEKTGMLPKEYVTTKKLVIIVAITLAVGLLLVSSGMTRLIGRLLFLITKYFA